MTIADDLHTIVTTRVTIADAINRARALGMDIGALARCADGVQTAAGLLARVNGAAQWPTGGYGEDEL